MGFFGKLFGKNTDEIKVEPDRKERTVIDYKTVFQGLSRNAIKLNIDTSSNAPVTVGVSKFGGQPDLPAGFQWPYYRYTDNKDTEHSKPLTFLLQINCGELADYDADRLLPETGMLYFFYELETMTWGFDPKDKGSARVYYYDTDSLVRQPFPSDLPLEFCMPEFPVSFTVKNDLPDYEECAENYQTDANDYEEYAEQRKDFGYVEEESDRTKLLGYANIIQNDMLRECEHATNGIYCGDASVKLSEEQRRAFSENYKQWKLLLQMDTVYKENFELMFGDAGHIYYYIRESDLADKNFDNCWLILQCY